MRDSKKSKTSNFSELNRNVKRIKDKDLLQEVTTKRKTDNRNKKKKSKEQVSAGVQLHTVGVIPNIKVLYVKLEALP